MVCWVYDSGIKQSKAYKDPSVYSLRSVRFKECIVPQQNQTRVRLTRIGGCIVPGECGFEIKKKPRQTYGEPWVSASRNVWFRNKKSHARLTRNSGCIVLRECGFEIKKKPRETYEERWAYCPRRARFRNLKESHARLTVNRGCIVLEMYDSRSAWFKNKKKNDARLTRNSGCLILGERGLEIKKNARDLR